MKNEIMEKYPCKDCKIFEDSEKCTRSVKEDEIVYKGCKDWKDWYKESWSKIQVMFGGKNEED
jgi:hypothetical protein